MTKRFNLTELQGAAVQSALDRISAGAGHKLTLNGLFNDWSVFVAEVERGYKDTIYDYTNTLGIRDILEELCGSLPGSVAEHISLALGPLDARFESATVLSSNPIIAGADDQSTRWYRVPKILSDALKSDIESESRE